MRQGVEALTMTTNDTDFRVQFGVHSLLDESQLTNGVVTCLEWHDEILDAIEYGIKVKL